MQQLLATSDTTSLSYWWNWRVLVSAIWVFTPMLVAFFLIRKYESLDSCKGKTQQEAPHSLCANQPWRPCLNQIHPIWLLAYRLISFSLLLPILIAKVCHNGFVMFYYYTQLTFTSVTIYFGFGSLLSIYGCYQYYKRGGAGFYEPHVRRDTEQEYYIPLTHGDKTNILEQRKSSDPQQEIHSSQAASICSYLFQVIFQMTAGAVMLTDSVYWFIIFPFLTIRDYSLDFLTVNMHSLNLVLLLGDAALNCLWIVHACVSIWWPYPFLDLSSPYAPLWFVPRTSYYCSDMMPSCLPSSGMAESGFLILEDCTEATLYVTLTQNGKGKKDRAAMTLTVTLVKKSMTIVIVNKKIMATLSEEEKKQDDGDDIVQAKIPSIGFDSLTGFGQGARLDEILSFMLEKICKFDIDGWASVGMVPYVVIFYLSNLHREKKVVEEMPKRKEDKRMNVYIPK
ncbi:unnamed protein product [Dovyalis caffra]|uniref:Transmembrane protein n=1 Tax=Dovyalis caffra TaxID=77055 RepID=A0AAV1R5L7_9ROSI|nr:unnamed protein product [Dovyalis caffra]